MLTNYIQCKSKFYASFNSIDCKSDNSNENVIISLMKSYCLPAMYYGLEAVDLNQSDINSLDTPIKRGLGKIFKTYDSDVLQWTMFYFKLLPTKYELAVRKFKFLTKLTSINNVCVNILQNNSICDDLNTLKLKFKIEPKDSFISARERLMNIFETSLN